MLSLKKDIPIEMGLRLEGKVAIITGGARGIGEAAVRLFAKHGANVIIADLEDAEGQKLAESLAPAVTFLHCNVTKEEDVANVVDTAVSKYGKLDIMFNNAGILGRQRSILDFDGDEFDKIVAVNVKGMAFGVKHAARVMVPKRSGSIICTASISSVQGGLGPHAYTMSKHGVLGLTRNAACELGKHGIRVNCVSPFGVATHMAVQGGKVTSEAKEKVEEFIMSLGNLKGTPLTPEDVAEGALYLASDEARCISGLNLVVDGGLTAVNSLHTVLPSF
uniref:TSA: Wollemia nobilis Ref_Wollemi_Transcript_13563_1107 transcribed RNA sequence n=1 Tax=Wollemia nobilis TaxID=56998 RepID=A0A0C9RKK9_9CONI